MSTLEVTDMLRTIRRRVAVGFGVVAVGALAVACSGGAPRFTSPIITGPVHLAGFSIELPPLASPFDKAAMASPTQAQVNAAASVHANSEGCPLALPEN
jgi:hypothetical protein